MGLCVLDCNLESTASVTSCRTLPRRYCVCLLSRYPSMYSSPRSCGSVFMTLRIVSSSDTFAELKTSGGVLGCRNAGGVRGCCSEGAVGGCLPAFVLAASTLSPLMRLMKSAAMVDVTDGLCLRFFFCCISESWSSHSSLVHEVVSWSVLFPCVHECSLGASQCHCVSPRRVRDL